jgi:putative ABC transport system permease protein
MRTRLPRIAGLSVGLPFTVYVGRLRAKPAQELLAAAGIAVGVALVFGVLVANTSLTSSVSSLIHQLVGSAQLQLVARSQEGFDQRLAQRIEGLPGVHAAAPLLRKDISIVGPRGSESIQLIGVTSDQLKLNAPATRNLSEGAASLIAGGIGLPSSVAAAIGVHAEQTVVLRADGRLRRVRVRVVLGNQTVGTVASSPVAIATLYTAQVLTGAQGRVTNVLVQAETGAQPRVTRELGRIAGGRINVTSAGSELRLFNTAAKPNQQSTTLFAAIAGMVGFLLALNAMLLTVPERRRFVADWRTLGYDPVQIAVLLGVQALAVGAIGSTVGIAAGLVLAHTLFGEVPSYLSAAFPVGTSRVITPYNLLIAIGCGLLAALLASMRPLLDIRSDHAMDTVTHESGEVGQSISHKATVAFGFTGLALMVVAGAIAATVPRLTIVGGVVLGVAAVCLVPSAYTAAVAVLRRPSERGKGALARAVVELDATATRSVALAAIIALAVYGSLAVGGARADLTHGLETAIAQYERTADLWVTTENVFNTDSFGPDGIAAAIARSPGVRAVRVDHGALLDVGDRRLMVRVHDPDTPRIIQSTQVIRGNYAHAVQLLRTGGWATVSEAFAEERHLRVGGQFALPTPSGNLRLGVAAITTNLGWPAGAIALSSRDYTRGWQTTNPTAYEVMLKPGVTIVAGKRTVQAALGPDSGLRVRSFGEREAQTDESARQGLSTLGQISMLLLVTGALAVAASLGAAIWQRRGRLAAMKTWGYDHFQLWRSLLMESTILLAVGCVDGAILGLYGHWLADRWLRLTTNFPAPFAVGVPLMFLTVAFVIAIAQVVIAVPGLTATRVPPSVSFQE